MMNGKQKLTRPAKRKNACPVYVQDWQTFSGLTCH